VAIGPDEQQLLCVHPQDLAIGLRVGDEQIRRTHRHQRPFGDERRRQQTRRRRLGKVRADRLQRRRDWLAASIDLVEQVRFFRLQAPGLRLQASTPSGMKRARGAQALGFEHRGGG